MNKYAGSQRKRQHKWVFPLHFQTFSLLLSLTFFFWLMMELSSRSRQSHPTEYNNISFLSIGTIFGSARESDNWYIIEI